MFNEKLCFTSGVQLPPPLKAFLGLTHRTVKGIGIWSSGIETMDKPLLTLGKRGFFLKTEAWTGETLCPKFPGAVSVPSAFVNFW